MSADKRRFPRYRERIGVQLRRASFDFALETVDVSREGLAVRTGDLRALPRSQQEIVSLLVSIPDNGPVLRVIGQVAWSRQDERGVELGVRFYLIAREEKERWDAWIEEVAERQRGKAAAEARKKVEEARMRPPPVRERHHGRDVAEAPASTEIPASRPWVVAVDPEYDRARRRFPRQRMLFMIRHMTGDALRAYVERELAAGWVVLNAPRGQFQAGEQVNLVLVHPRTEAEFELLARVTEVEAGVEGAILALAPQIDAALRAELERFVATGVAPE